jgi:hypothetical protein
MSLLTELSAQIHLNPENEYPFAREQNNDTIVKAEQFKLVRALVANPLFGHLGVDDSLKYTVHLLLGIPTSFKSRHPDFLLSLVRKLHTHGLEKNNANLQQLITNILSEQNVNRGMSISDILSIDLEQNHIAAILTKLETDLQSIYLKNDHESASFANILLKLVLNQTVTDDSLQQRLKTIIATIKNKTKETEGLSEKAKFMIDCAAALFIEKIAEDEKEKLAIELVKYSEYRWERIEAATIIKIIDKINLYDAINSAYKQKKLPPWFTAVVASLPQFRELVTHNLLPDKEATLSKQIAEYPLEIKKHVVIPANVIQEWLKDYCNQPKAEHPLISLIPHFEENQEVINQVYAALEKNDHLSNAIQAELANKGCKKAIEHLRKSINLVDRKTAALYFRITTTSRLKDCLPDPNQTWHTIKNLDSDMTDIGILYCLTVSTKNPLFYRFASVITSLPFDSDPRKTTNKELMIAKLLKKTSYFDHHLHKTYSTVNNSYLISMISRVKPLPDDKVRPTTPREAFTLLLAGTDIGTQFPEMQNLYTTLHTFNGGKEDLQKLLTIADHAKLGTEFINLINKLLADARNNNLQKMLTTYLLDSSFSAFKKPEQEGKTTRRLLHSIRNTEAISLQGFRSIDQNTISTNQIRLFTVFCSKREKANSSVIPKGTTSLFMCSQQVVRRALKLLNSQPEYFTICLETLVTLQKQGEPCLQKKNTFTTNDEKIQAINDLFDQYAQATTLIGPVGSIIFNHFRKLDSAQKKEIFAKQISEIQKKLLSNALVDTTLLKSLLPNIDETEIFVELALTTFVGKHISKDTATRILQRIENVDPTMQTTFTKHYKVPSKEYQIAIGKYQLKNTAKEAKSIDLLNAISRLNQNDINAFSTTSNTALLKKAEQAFQKYSDTRHSNNDPLETKQAKESYWDALIGLLYKARIVETTSIDSLVARNSSAWNDATRYQVLNQLYLITGDGKGKKEAPLLAGHDFHPHENSLGFEQWFEQEKAKCGKDISLSYQQILQDIHGMGAKIRKEIDKYESVIGETTQDFTIQALRNPAAFLSWGAAGLCTANDSYRYTKTELENDVPDIFQFIISDARSSASGMAIAYIVEQDKQKSLLFRQPNAHELLKIGFNPLSICVALIQAAIDFAEANSIQYIDIPLQTSDKILANDNTMEIAINKILRKCPTKISYQSEYPLSSNYKATTVKRASVSQLKKILSTLV